MFFADNLKIHLSIPEYSIFITILCDMEMKSYHV